MDTEPVINSQDFNARQIKRIFWRRMAIVLWASFFTAAVQSMVFFALFDPAYLGQLSSFAMNITRLQGYTLGACPRTGNLLRNHWIWPVSPLIFVKYAYIRLKLVKKLTQTSYFSLRLLFWDKLLGFVFFWVFTFSAALFSGLVLALPRTRLAKRNPNA